MKNKFTYKCPSCGKRVVLGEHFCIVNNTDKVNNHNKVSIKYVITVTIGVISLLIFLWSQIGLYSLLFLGFFAVFIPVIYLFKKYNNSKANSLYETLLKMVGYDTYTAERLINCESKKGILKNRKECIRNAIEKLLYDRK